MVVLVGGVGAEGQGRAAPGFVLVLLGAAVVMIHQFHPRNGLRGDGGVEGAGAFGQHAGGRGVAPGPRGAVALGAARLGPLAAFGLATLARVLLGLGGGSGGALLLQQGAAILGRDLVIVGVNLGKGEEAVAVAAIVHEGRLQRGFDPRHLGEIDVSGELPFVDRLEIELVNLGSVHHDHPSFLGMGGVDQHFLGHCSVFRATAVPAGQVARRDRGCGLSGGMAGQGLRTRRPGQSPAGVASR